MTEQRHTPGPWTYDDDDFKTYIVPEDRPCYYIGELWDGSLDEAGSYPSRGEREANARLIAAAPELLEALQAMVARYASHASGREDPREPAQARAAIEKATGDVAGGAETRSTPTPSGRTLEVVLAALRYMQHDLEPDANHLARADVTEILESGPTTAGEIDRICEELNRGE